MTKDQAKQKFREAIYEATQILEDLQKEGRIGNNGKAASLAETRELRNEFADEGAGFIDGAWLSFDQSPNESELSDAVDEDEGDGDGDGDPPAGEDATVPGMDSALLAQEERKRLDGESGDEDAA